MALPNPKARNRVYIQQLLNANATGPDGLPMALSALWDDATQAYQLAVTSAPPVGGATAANQVTGNNLLTSIDGKLPPLILGGQQPTESNSAMVVAKRPMVTWRASFSRAIASGIDSEYFVPVGTAGPGHVISQAGGNLSVVCGTTANSEAIFRSVRSFTGSLLLRYGVSFSARSLNNNCAIELVDVLGDGLAFTINSATSITVTFPSTNPFIATNVGQSVSIGALTGTAGTIPGRYAISAVSGLTVTLTVAGFPASGSGTLSMYGWNFFRCLYSGASTTAMTFDTGRRGYANGGTSPTVNTITAPGHLVQLNTYGGVQALLLDRLRAPTALWGYTQRADYSENIPENETQLFVQIRSTNGTAAPSAVTWTVNFVSIEDTVADPVILESLMPQTPLPMQIIGTPSVSVSGTATTQGPLAHDAPVASAQPFLGALEARNTNPAAVSASGDVARGIGTMIGAAIVQPYSIPEQHRSFNSALTTTTPVAALAAAGTGLRNYVTMLTATNAGASAVDLILLDGVTERNRWTLPVNVVVSISFPTSPQTTANTALNLNLSAAGTVRASGTAFIAP